jgi:hypothetical protein
VIDLEEAELLPALDVDEARLAPVSEFNADETAGLTGFVFMGGARATREGSQSRFGYILQPTSWPRLRQIRVDQKSGKVSV